MRHFWVAEAGAELQLVDRNLPEPQPNEVQIKTLAAGVAYVDILMRHGLYPAQRPFPLIPGYDVVGIIEKTGHEVHSLHPGQRVAALTVVGGYAERINIPAADAVLVPEGVDTAEGVSLILNYLTAYQILHRTLQVREGERILIHSAAGGVGTALLQLGKLAGLEMFGTASRGKRELIQSLGAVPIDYQNEDFVERIHALTGTGADIVLDPIGGDHLRESYRALTGQGRLVAFGTLAAFKDGKPQPGVLETYKASIEQFNQNSDGRRALPYSLNATRSAHPQWIQEDLITLFGLLAARAVQPVIDRCLALTDAPLAHELLQTGQVSGKLVLRCN